jgi:hypothetical protein
MLAVAGKGSSFLIGGGFVEGVDEATRCGCEELVLLPIIIGE